MLPSARPECLRETERQRERESGEGDRETERERETERHFGSSSLHRNFIGSCARGLEQAGTNRIHPGYIPHFTASLHALAHTHIYVDNA